MEIPKCYSDLDTIPTSIVCGIIKDLPFKLWMPIFFYLVRGREFKLYQGHHKILKTYTDIYNMKEKRIILNAPPRSGKSTIAAYFMIYTLIHEPAAKFIYISYNDDRAEAEADEIRFILNSEAFINGYGANSIYGENFNFSIKNTITNTPGHELINSTLDEITKKRKKDKCINTKFLFASGGEIRLFSSSGAVTGNGAGIHGVTDHFTGCIIYDDPNKPKPGFTVIRDQINENFHGCVYTRLENKSNTALVVMQQRIAIDDLSGYLLNHNQDYKFKHIKIPLVEEDGTVNFDYTPEDVKTAQTNINTYNVQYQQSPELATNNIIDITKFKEYNTDPYELRCDMYFITTDYAYTVGMDSDYTCLMFWGSAFNRITNKMDIFLIDMVHGRYKTSDKVKLTVEFYQKWENKPQKYIGRIHISYVFIEKNGNIDFLNQLKYFMLPITQLIRGEDTKLGRGTAFANGFGLLYDVHLPTTYNYVSEEMYNKILKECKSFTGQKNSVVHDDIVDNIIDAAHVAQNTKRPNL